MKKVTKIRLSLLFAALMLAQSACSAGNQPEETPKESFEVVVESGTQEPSAETPALSETAPRSESEGTSSGAPEAADSQKVSAMPIDWAHYVAQNYDSIREITHYIEEQTGWGEHFQLQIDMIMEKDDWGNVLYSPLSLDILLAMISNGADEELQNAFKEYFGSGTNGRNSWYRSLVENKGSLEFANAFFLNDGYIFDDNFLDKIETYYHADHIVCPFDASFSERANAWVAEKTKGLIKELPSQNIEGLDAIALNALAFNAGWAKDYKDPDVRETEFRLPLYEQSVKVTGLYSTESVYLENDQAIGFMKSYAPEADGASRYAFVGILPKVTADDKVQTGYESFVPANEGDSFDFDLSRIDFRSLLDSAKWTYEVDVMIPEFSFEMTNNLLPAMESVGLGRISEENAFPGLAAAKTGALEAGFTLTALLQKARIEVTREGTKAAAVSEADFTGAGMPEPTQHKSVILDRPFAFMIYDTKTQSVLFVGKVVNPAEQN